ncbi:MAG: ATP-binding protein [Planctomycetes bacterium]|nr:ATP-binding protein [Planctomycetota bacterium]
MAERPAVLRSRLRAELDDALARSPAAILLGSRQCGKTTLARELVAPDSPRYFDLENPLHLRRLAEPMTALEPLEGVVVVVEIHRRPDLFPMLRVLADRSPLPARFLLLGSASMDLMAQASESLAGRAAILSMSGFSLDEVGAAALDTLWLRGGYPRSFLAPSDETSMAWRRDYVHLVLERDVRQFGSTIAPQALHRFWSMVAHVHGNVWNSADPARSLGVAESTVRRYLDLMTDLLLLRQLQPWHENLGKRQVKAPKVYFRDPGLLHHFLGVTTANELLGHTRCGASWEGFVLEEVLRCVRPDAEYFWATHAGAELDLLLFRGGKRLGVAIKRVDAPGMTKSMAIAREDLHLDALAVVYPGPQRYAIEDGVEAVPLRELEQNGPHVLFPKLFSRPPARKRKAAAAKRRRR